MKLYKNINKNYAHQLISKIKHPFTVVDYRPISLYNVIYKLILNVLANQIRAILPH